MGRKKTPTKLKLLKGTAQKCRMNPNEPDPEPSAPMPPAHLVSYALEEWNRIIPLLYKLGLMSGDRIAVVAAYCSSYHLWRLASEGFKDLDMDDKEWKVLVRIANQAARDMVKFASEIGITPASAPKVTAIKPSSINPWDDI